MKRTIISALILAAGLGSLSLAHARGPAWGCEGYGPMAGPLGHGARPVAAKFDPVQRAERRLAVFKAELKLTPEQEPLWQAFAEQAKAEAGKGFKAWQAQAADAALTAPERMARLEALMEERLAAMKGVHERFNRLYAALSPEQKKIADQHAAFAGPGRMLPPAPPARTAPPAPPTPQG